MQAQIVRGSDGAIVNLIAQPYNLSSTEVEGYDMTVNYRLPETSFGRFSFNWDTTYLANVENNNDGDNLVGEYFDRSNNWRIRSNLATRWELGDFGATWNVRYYSRQEEACPFYYNDYGFGELCNDPVFADASTGELAFDDDGNALSQNRIGATTYHDLSGYWNAPWNAKIALGVNNVFDKNPPVSFTTFANSFDPQYEIPGRFYYMRYTQKF